MIRRRVHLERATPAAFGSFASLRRPRLQEALEREISALAIGFPSMDAALATALGVGATPGRRWRPLLALATAEALGADIDDRLIDLALAVELTHTASLILDDLPCMDDDAERRGEPSTHRLVGTGGALLMAVGLLARSAELLGATGPAGGELASAWGHTFGLAGMSGGQAVDLSSGAQARGPKRRLYRQKSTALVAFAVDGAALLSDCPAGGRTVLGGFGRDLGWAYQLADDVVDRIEDAETGRVTQPTRATRMGPRILERALSRLETSTSLSHEGYELLASAAVAVASFPTEVASC